jgi:polyribonucleotide nucleotidyltransferase
MDFKVAGSQVGVTAVQMDIKMTGITQDLMRRALDQAKEGRIFILKKMLAALPRPRDEYHPLAPRVEAVQINPEKIGALIGPGGKNIRRIQEESGATIEVDDSGLVKIFATTGEAAKAARQQVEAITQEAVLGKIYDGRVTSVKEFGAFYEIIPGIEGLCHVSELADGYVSRVSDVVKVGDTSPVKVILVDDSGRVKLSRRQALLDLGRTEEARAPAGSAVGPEADPDGGPDGGAGGGPGGGYRGGDYRGGGGGGDYRGGGRRDDRGGRGGHRGGGGRGRR